MQPKISKVIRKMSMAGPYIGLSEGVCVFLQVTSMAVSFGVRDQARIPKFCGWCKTRVRGTEVHSGVQRQRPGEESGGQSC